jgi:hypothetical protein
MLRFNTSGEPGIQKKQGRMRPAYTLNTVKCYFPPEGEAGFQPAVADVIDARTRGHVVIQMTPGRHNFIPAKGVSQTGYTLSGKIQVP